MADQTPHLQTDKVSHLRSEAMSSFGRRGRKVQLHHIPCILISSFHHILVSTYPHILEDVRPRVPISTNPHILISPYQHILNPGATAQEHLLPLRRLLQHQRGHPPICHSDPRTFRTRSQAKVVKHYHIIFIANLNQTNSGDQP